MVTTLQTGGLLGCLLSGISDKPARRKFDRGEAGDTSSATTLRGKFPKVAVEYTGPDRIHQIRPSHDASVRAAAMHTFLLQYWASKS